MDNALSPPAIVKAKSVSDVDKIQSKMKLRKRKVIDYSCSSKNIDNGGSKDCGKMNDIENNFLNEESEGYTSVIDKSNKNYEKSSNSKKRKKSSYHSSSANQVQNPDSIDPSLIIKAPNFEVLYYEWYGEPRSRLFIFTSSNDKTLCYDYAWSKSENKYVCNPCRTRGGYKHITATIQNFSNGEEYAKLNNFDHRCNPVKYDPEKYNFSVPKQILKPPNYEIMKFEKKGILKKKLFIFTSIEKKLGYSYFWKDHGKKFFCYGCHSKSGKSTTAKLCTNKNGEEYLQLNKSEHICIIREQYPPKKTKNNENNILFYKPDYKIIDYSINGNNNKMKKLFVIIPENKELCYEFSYSKTKNYFYCSKCFSEKQYVLANICTEEDGTTEFLSQNNLEHVCIPQPIPYLFNLEISNNGGPQIIIQKPNFQFLQRKCKSKNGLFDKLVIFLDEEKKLCYEYSKNVKLNIWRCWICKKHHSAYVTAKHIKNSENDEYIELGNNQHLCNPIPFVPENNIIKTIKKPQFLLEEYQPTNNKEKRFKRLIIFDKVDKNLCYVYGNPTKNRYLCNKCRKLNKSVNAKLFIDIENGENYLELNDTEHICSMDKYDQLLPAVKVF